MAKGNLPSDLLGASFAIRAMKSEYLEAIYSHYKKTVSRIESSAKLTDLIAILAGILAADEYYKEKMKHADEDSDIDLSEAEKLALRISRIDQVI